jgi:hypothetical protein
MQKKYIIKCISVFFLLLPFVTHAHPGHGDHTHDGFSVIHYFTEPVHIAVLVAVLATVVIALMVRRQNTPKKLS